MWSFRITPTTMRDSKSSKNSIFPCIHIKEQKFQHSKQKLTFGIQLHWLRCQWICSYDFFQREDKNSLLSILIINPKEPILHHIALQRGLNYNLIRYTVRTLIVLCSSYSVSSERRRVIAGCSLSSQRS